MYSGGKGPGERIARRWEMGEEWQGQRQAGEQQERQRRQRAGRKKRQLTIEMAECEPAIEAADFHCEFRKFLYHS